jgi:hypothetical protein
MTDEDLLDRQATLRLQEAADSLERSLATLDARSIIALASPPEPHGGADTELGRPRRVGVAGRVLIVGVVAAASVGIVIVSQVAGRQGSGSRPSATTSTLTHPTINASPVVSPVDTAATPPGWGAVPFLGIQISVPANWYREGEGSATCGGHPAGMVFVGQLTTTLPSVMRCPLATDTATIGAASRPTGGSTVRTINGLHVETAATHGYYKQIAWYHGVEITAAGPLAANVIATLTTSPLSFVLSGATDRVPAPWTQVDFGDITLSVPSHWQTYHDDPCGLSLIRHAVVLSGPTQQATAPSCGYESPPPPGTVDGVLIGKLDVGPDSNGPPLTEPACLAPRHLDVCVETRSEWTGVLWLYVEGQAASHLEEIGIGLGGNGETALAILDSLRIAGTSASNHLVGERTAAAP